MEVGQTHYVSGTVNESSIKNNNLISYELFYEFIYKCTQYSISSLH